MLIIFDIKGGPLTHHIQTPHSHTTLKHHTHTPHSHTTLTHHRRGKVKAGSGSGINHSGSTTLIGMHHIDIRSLTNLETSVIVRSLKLKGVCHNIFDLHFLHDLNPSGPLINRLKYFLIQFRFRRDIRSHHKTQSSKNSTLGCA